MIELVTRGSIMFDYVKNRCCFEYVCHYDNGTGTRMVRYYDIVLDVELNSFELIQTLNPVKCNNTLKFFIFSSLYFVNHTIVHNEYIIYRENK